MSVPLRLGPHIAWCEYNVQSLEVVKRSSQLYRLRMKTPGRSLDTPDASYDQVIDWRREILKDMARNPHFAISAAIREEHFVKP